MAEGLERADGEAVGEGEGLGDGGAGLSVLRWTLTPGARLLARLCAAVAVLSALPVSEAAMDPPWLQAPRMRQAPSSAATREERGRRIMPSLGTRCRCCGAPGDRVVDHRNAVILPRITAVKNAIAQEGPE